jgi:hypothetical protein
MPDAAERAQSLAAARGARAVVGISSAAARPSRWVYDVATRRAVAVPLRAPPPFDPPTAAAIALAIKTLLRFSRAAPPAERYELPRPAPRRALLFEARVGARLRPDAQVEPALALAAVVTTRGLAPFGLFAVLRAGPGVAVETSSFVGHYDDIGLGLGARLAVDLPGRLALIPSAGVSGHLGTLRGADLALGASGFDRHLNPAIDLGLQLELDLGRPRLGIAAGAAAFVRRQRFLVAGEEVYDIPPVVGEVSATAALAF